MVRIGTGRAAGCGRSPIAVVLTFGYALVELIGGLWSGSLALIADAGHMVTDSAALLFAFAASLIARRPVSDRHSYGLARVEVIAAFVNSLAMLGRCRAGSSSRRFTGSRRRSRSKACRYSASPRSGLRSTSQSPGRCRAIVKTSTRGRRWSMSSATCSDPSRRSPPVSSSISAARFSSIRCCRCWSAD